LNGSFKECSKALAKLKNLSNFQEKEDEKIDELSFSIFTKYKPENKNEHILNCPGKDCGEKISEL
jgi:hypothetical protein